MTRETSRAILYGRVSTDSQAESGFSLAQQTEALRAWAAREGYEVVEEVSDPGFSGSYLERPGLDRVRDLVADGGISVVLAQDRDRFSREPAYLYLLREEFAEHGCRLRALNDHADGESPEGELTDGILDQLAKFERAKFRQRSRRGRKRRAQEGKVIPGRYPKYGFRLAADAYEVDEERMPLVRRVFRMVGEEGYSLRAVAKSLDSEQMPTPGGGKFWDRTLLRSWILDDAYKPHTYEEVAAVASPEAVAGLDLAASYGILWWGRRETKTRQVSEYAANGERRYRKSYSYRQTAQEEQTPLPVPDAGIPRSLVEAARRSVESNIRPSAADGRFWELSGGIAVCGECGRRMRCRTKNKVANGKRYKYLSYRCGANESHGRQSCINNKNAAAGPLERHAFKHARWLFSHPEELRADLKRMIELERADTRGEPEAEKARWLKQLADIDAKSERYQDQQAEGLIGMDKLREKLSGLTESRQIAQRELEAVRSRAERLEWMERGVEELIEHYAALAPEALESLEPSERHHLYNLLDLKALVYADGSVRVSTPVDFCQSQEHTEVCPHGRPIVRRVPLADLLREFGRG